MHDFCRPYTLDKQVATVNSPTASCMAYYDVIRWTISVASPEGESWPFGYAQLRQQRMPTATTPSSLASEDKYKAVIESFLFQKAARLKFSSL
jgi:hypothetical protein